MRVFGSNPSSLRNGKGLASHKPRQIGLIVTGLRGNCGPCFANSNALWEIRATAAGDSQQRVSLSGELCWQWDYSILPAVPCSVPLISIQLSLLQFHITVASVSAARTHLPHYCPARNRYPFEGHTPNQDNLFMRRLIFPPCWRALHGNILCIVS